MQSFALIPRLALSESCDTPQGQGHDPHPLHGTHLCHASSLMRGPPDLVTLRTPQLSDWGGVQNLGNND